MAYRGCKYYHHGCELGGPCDGACAYYQDSDDDFIHTIQHPDLSTDASNQANASSKKIVEVFNALFTPHLSYQLKQRNTPYHFSLLHNGKEIQYLHCSSFEMVSFYSFHKNTSCEAVVLIGSPVVILNIDTSELIYSGEGTVNIIPNGVIEIIHEQEFDEMSGEYVHPKTFVNLPRNLVLGKLYPLTNSIFKQITITTEENAKQVEAIELVDLAGKSVCKNDFTYLKIAFDECIIGHTTFNDSLVLDLNGHLIASFSSKKVLDVYNRKFVITDGIYLWAEDINGNIVFSKQKINLYKEDLSLRFLPSGLVVANLGAASALYSQSGEVRLTDYFSEAHIYKNIIVLRNNYGWYRTTAVADEIYDFYGNQLICGHNKVVAINDSGYLPVYNGQYWGLINEWGKIILPFVYYRITISEEGITTGSNTAKFSYQTNFTFSGIPYIETDCSRYYYDKNYLLVSPSVQYTDRIIIRKTDLKYGVLSANGQEIIPCIYTSIKEVLNKDFSFVCYKDKDRFIYNKDGNLVKKLTESI